MNFQLMENCIKRAAVIVLLAASSFAAIEAGLLLRQARKDEMALAKQSSQVMSETSATVADVNRTVLVVGGVAAQIRAIAKEEHAQSQTQARLINQDLTKLGAAIDTINGAVQNQNVQLTSIETQTSFDLTDTDRQLNETFDALQPAIQSIANGVPVIVQNAEDTSGQVSQMAQHGNAATQNVEVTTGYVRDYVHRLTTPVRGTWNFIKSLLVPIANIRTIQHP